MLDQLKNNIKAKVNDAMHRQILAYNPLNNTLSREGISKGLLGDSTGKPEEISTDSWLEWHQVYGGMQNLVAKCPALQNTVGVLAPYSDARMQEWAMSVAEEIIWEQEGLKTRKTPAGDTVLDEDPLPSLQGLSLEAQAERNRIQDQRNEAAKTHRQKAQKLLSDHGLLDNFFSIYLETLLENGHLLGNPHKPNLPLDECVQLIIPFHYHDNHYTVAVCHFREKSGNGVADIKYYDSNGSDLEPDLQMQFYKHFQTYIYENGKNFVVNYNCISSPDQMDGHNCSIFACFKAFDIANQNINQPARFLSDLTHYNYQTTMNCYRRFVAEGLQKTGQNVISSDKLNTALDKAQQEFEDLSELSQNISSFNGFVKDVIKDFETVLMTVQGPIDPVKIPVIANDKQLPDIDPMLFLNKLRWFYNRAAQVLHEKMQIVAPCQKDKDDIALLQKLIKSFNGISANIAREAQYLSKHMPQKTLPYVSVLSDYSWYAVWLIAAMTTVGLFAGIPLLLAGILKVAPLLPNNLFLLMLLGGAGAKLVFMINDYFNPEERRPTLPPQPQPRPEAQPQPEPQLRPELQPEPEPQIQPDGFPINETEKALLFNLNRETRKDEKVFQLPTEEGTHQQTTAVQKKLVF